AALRAPALQDQTAGSRRHAGAEAVPALPAAHVWLVGAFHALERVKSRRSSRGGGQYRRIPRSGVVHSPPAGEKAWKRGVRPLRGSAFSTPVETGVEECFSPANEGILAAASWPEILIETAAGALLLSAPFRRFTVRSRCAFEP